MKPNSLGVDSTGSSPISNFDPDYNGEATRDGWLFYLANNGAWNFRIGSHSGYAVTFVATNGIAVIGSWQHIVGTWDGLTAKMYINGVLAGAKYATVSGAAPGNNPPFYGNSHSIIRFGGTQLNGTGGVTPSAISPQAKNGNRGYDGYMQQVAIYTNVLTPSQIAAHYMAASTNNAGYVAQIIADGPVSYWTMNDAPVATPSAPFPNAANSGSLGNAADATNFPGAWLAQPGPGYAGFGTDTNAVFYDGANGYMQVDNTPGLNISGNVTLAAWVKPTEQDFYRTIIEHGYDGNQAETFLRISTLDSSILGGTFYEIGASDGVNFYDSAYYQVPAGDIGNWVFLVGTYDGSNWNLYRDGQLVATLPPEDQGGSGAVNVTNQWTIGSRGPDASFAGQGSFFGGSIYQPAIFNTALSASDVMNLYNAAQVPPVITQAPVNPGVVFKNSSVSFSVVADGSPTLGYLWITNGISTGDTTTSFSITSIQTGVYTVGVIVTNAYGTNTPTVTFPVVPAPPVITQAPLPQTRFAGYSFSLSVSASGTVPLTYYWYKGSTLVQAGSSSSFSAVASPLLIGSYSVVVSNETSITVTSAPVAVNVYANPGGYPGAVIASGPLSYWRLDETSGSTAFDFIAGNNGNYNSATLGLPGYSVLDPDTAAGFSGLNSYVGNISGTAINFTNNNNFTLEAWVNAPANQSDQASIIAKGIGNNGTVENEQFALDVSGGAYRFFTTKGGTVTAATAVTGPNGSWQHIVGVYDAQNSLGGGAKMYIFVNGVAEGSFPTPTAPGQSPITSSVSIGSKRTGNDPNYDGTFNGTIDEVAVYNYALSSSTINDHYAAAYGTTLAPFINVQPIPQTNYAGLPITLSVAAAGSVTLHYQWYQGSTPVGGDSDQYPIPAAGLSDIGTYYVHISNGVGNTNSAMVYVSVLSAPTTPPSIPGLVMHLPLNGNLNDATGRGNNGTGLHSTWVVTTTPQHGTTNAVSPASNSSGNPSFYYTDGPLLGSSGLHYSTYAESTNLNGLDDYYVNIGGLHTPADLLFGSNVSFTVAFWIRLQPGYGNGPDFGGGGDLPFFTTAVGSLGSAGFDFATPYSVGTQGTGATPDQNNAGSWCNSFYNTSSGAGVALMGSLYPGDINAYLADGNWHCLVNVVNRTTSTTTTYLDGVVPPTLLERGTKLADAGDIDSGNPATIGQDPRVCTANWARET